MTQVVKNLSANAGDGKDPGSIPEPARSPEKGMAMSPQYSRLENPMNRGAWQATAKGSQIVGATEHTHTQGEYLVHYTSISQVFR